MDWSLGRTSARQDQTMGSPQGRNFESVYFTSNNVPPLYPNNHLGGSSDTVYFLNPMTPMDISPLVPRTPQYSGVSQGTSNEIAPIPLSRPSSTGEAIKMIALWDVPDTRKSTKGGWTQVEDDMLRVVVMENDFKKWKKIASDLNETIGSTRTDVQCLHRWRKVIQPGLIKTQWTRREDLELIALVEKFGAQNWAKIANGLPGRAGKQCRDRWHNHLNPSVNKDPWTKKEEDTLKEMMEKHGNKWTLLAQSLPGRTANAIKNHYHTRKRREYRKKNPKNPMKRSKDVSKSTDDSNLPTSVSAGSDNYVGSHIGASSSTNHQAIIDMDVPIQRTLHTANTNVKVAGKGHVISGMALPPRKRHKSVVKMKLPEGDNKGHVMLMEGHWMTDENQGDVCMGEPDAEDLIIPLNNITLDAARSEYAVATPPRNRSVKSTGIMDPDHRIPDNRISLEGNSLGCVFLRDGFQKNNGFEEDANTRSSLPMRYAAVDSHPRNIHRSNSSGNKLLNSGYQSNTMHEGNSGNRSSYATPMESVRDGEHSFEAK